MDIKATMESLNEAEYQSSKSPTAPPQYSQLEQAVGCIMLCKADTIRLASLPESVRSLVRNAIETCWWKGLKAEGPYKDGDLGCWDYQCKGSPWRGQGEEAVSSRRLLLGIVQALEIAGWQLYTACDLSKAKRDLDTLFFRLGTPRQRDYFVISFNACNRIRLIDCPSSLVKETFSLAVHTYGLGVQSTREKEKGCLEFKLKGNPWFATGVDVTQGRILGCQLLKAMLKIGFELIASVDMSVGTGSPAWDVDTWLFASR